jgi:hypothetical protein
MIRVEIPEGLSDHDVELLVDRETLTLIFEALTDLDPNRASLSPSRLADLIRRVRSIKDAVALLQ